MKLGFLQAVTGGVAILGASALRADVEVHVEGEHVNLKARSASVSDVLDRLARETGMKVVYEGPPPRQSLTVNIARATQVEVVLGLLEGQGLNYALRMDSTGRRIETLLMAGVVSTVSASPSRASPAVPPPPRFTPPQSEDEPVTIPEADTPDEQAPPPPVVVTVPDAPGGAPGLVLPLTAPSAPAGAPTSLPPAMFGARPGFPLPENTPPVEAPPGGVAPIPMSLPPAMFGARPGPSPSPPETPPQDDTSR